MKYENNPTLREYLHRGAAGPYREHARHPAFEFDAAAFATTLEEIRAQHPQLTADEAAARAAFRLLTSGAPPEIAVALPSPWYRLRASALRAAPILWRGLKLVWAIALLALAVATFMLLGILAAHAEPPAPEPTPQPAVQPTSAAGANQLRAIRSALAAWPALPQQPGGLILQLQNGGSVLATRPAGLVVLNCATNMTCSFSGSTFTLAATGGGGSGCVPPGGTSNALLYDAGSGACADASKFTFASNTLTGASGATVDLTAIAQFKTRVGAGATASANGDLAQDSSTGYWHAYVNGNDRLFIGTTNVGASGQVAESNADGTATFADPIVSGPDATGVAPTRNPVQTGALDNGTACSAGPCVRSLVVASSAPAGSEYGLIVRPIPSGTQAVSGSVTVSGSTNAQPQASSSYASSTYDLAATAATNIKSSGGNVWGWYGFNPNASTCYLQFYNATSATLGTAALHPFGVAAGASFNLAPGSVALFNLSTGISTGETTTATGGTACGEAMVITILYE